LRAHALGFYQPQSAKARAVVALLRGMSRLGLPLPLHHADPAIPSDPGFHDFLARCAGSDNPRFALLCGNPNAPGRRFMMLLFGREEIPSCVVKYGLTPQAHALIQREADFLQSSCKAYAGLPQLLACHQTQSVSAFAIPYSTGRQLLAQDFPVVVRCLENWIHRDSPQPLGEIPGWKRLLALPDCPPELQRVADCNVHPVLYHGDFTPWNMRISSTGDLQVFDWERGEQAGVPGWDWLHYRVQQGILVDKKSPNALSEVLRKILGGTAWHEYAEKTGIESLGYEIVRGYLLYHLKVCPQTEGADALKDLERIF
jgi:hypothetical protein